MEQVSAGIHVVVEVDNGLPLGKQNDWGVWQIL